MKIQKPIIENAVCTSCDTLQQVLWDQFGSLIHCISCDAAPARLIKAVEELKTIKKTYEFNAGDEMIWHENIYRTDKEYCAVCGKSLGKNPIHVEVHNGGDLVEFGKGIQDSGYMGCWAIGSTCANKFSPELRGII